MEKLRDLVNMNQVKLNDDIVSSCFHFHVNGIMIASHEKSADYVWGLEAQKELRSSGVLSPAFNCGDGSDANSEGFETVHPGEAYSIY